MHYDYHPVFFFNDPPTTELYTLSLHDALPISSGTATLTTNPQVVEAVRVDDVGSKDRKSTRLNSSHANISYAVFCLKKKKHLSLRDCIRRVLCVNAAS